jgi:hypothetical protein
MVTPKTGDTVYVDRQLAQIPVTTGAGAFTLTLAQPTKAGLVATVNLDTDGGGDCTLTVAGGYNADADTAIVLGDAGDFVTLLSVKVGASCYWRVLAQEGTDAAVEDITVDTLTAADATLTAATVTTLNAPAVAAEHGAGAIGSGVAPTTTRRTENGTIITEIKIDLTGLASVATADDIIGLAAETPPAYIGKNDVAKNGIIYRVEMVCLETPAAGDDDINLVAGSAADEHVDDAVTGAAVIINGGDQVGGMVTVNNAPALTADHYFYLTAGTGEAETYTAGQLMIRLYGHSLLA